MKRKLLLLSILLLISILLIIRILPEKKQADDAQKPPDAAIPAEVSVVRDTSMVYRLSAPGTLRAAEEVEITGEISRKIVGIFMKDGAFVEKGALIFKLDDAETTADLDKLRVEIRLAEANEERQRVQLDKGGISREQYDATLNRLEVLRAEVAIREVELAKTEIRAPFAGKLGIRMVSPGALVRPGMLLTTLWDVNRLKVDFSLPEKYAADLRPGAPIRFQSEYREEQYPAVVESVVPAADASTRTIMLRAIFNNTGGELVPGTSVRVNLDLKSMVNRIFIPSSALIASAKGYHVFLVRQGKATQQPVKTGLRSRFSVEITDGIRPGDTVVLTNLLRIKPDSPIRIVKTD